MGDLGQQGRDGLGPVEEAGLVQQPEPVGPEEEAEGRRARDRGALLAHDVVEARRLQGVGQVHADGAAATDDDGLELLFLLRRVRHLFLSFVHLGWISQSGCTGWLTNETEMIDAHYATNFK